MLAVDLLISGGTVVDGTGNTGYRASVAIEGERLRIVRERELPEARKTIDATGLTVAPGFFDMHSHAGLMLLAEPDHFSKVSQGVTTEVIGVDGNSYAPFQGRQQLLDMVRMYAGLEGDPQLAYKWDSAGSYLEQFDRAVSVNVALLIGNSALRVGAIGWDALAADSSAIGTMRAMLREGMQEGAFGLSTGLDYPPGSYASTDELAALASEAAGWGGFYHTHPRNSLGDRFLDPLREAIQICRQAEAPLHLTHLFHRQTAPGGAERVFDLIESARTEGVEVTF